MLMKLQIDVLLKMLESVPCRDGTLFKVTFH